MPQPVEPPVVKSLGQLKMLLSDFLPNKNATDASFTVLENPEDPKKNQFVVDPGTKSYNRKLLEDGFKEVRNRIDYNKQLDSNFNIDEMRFWVDDLIRDKLGGTRKGEKIVWQIGEKTIEFDPFTSQLTEDGNPISTV